MTMARSRWQRALISLSVIIGALVVVTLVQRWRRAQFEGYGLTGVYVPLGASQGRRTTWRQVDQVVDPGLEPGRIPKALQRRPFRVEWSGAVVLPRDGRYEFGLVSLGPSELWIDERLVVSSGGRQTERPAQGGAWFSVGAHVIRIVYSAVDNPRVKPELRLLWQSVRRWRYLPPTLLLPGRPEGVDPSRAHSIPPRDPVAVVLIGFCAVMALVVLAYRPLSSWLRGLRQERWMRRDLLLFTFVLAAGVGVRLWDLSGAGQTWDEYVYVTAGRNFVQNLLAGDIRTLSWSWNFEHPATAKWIYGPAALFSESFGPSRAMGALTSGLTCALLFLVGRDLFSRRVGLLAGLLCAVTPHVVAHGKVIGLEAPSGLFYLLSVWLFVRGVTLGGRMGRGGGHLLAAGACAGLLVGTRLVNASVFGVWALAYLIICWPVIRAERRLRITVPLLCAPLVAAAVFFAEWPFLWQEPLANLHRMLAHWKPHTSMEIFLGARRQLPAYYYPLYFVVTMPAASLIALALALPAIALRRCGRGLIVLLWACGPFVVALSPLVRDGVRYLYPALIPACLLAALGAEHLVTLAGRLLRRRSLGPVFWPLGAVLLGGAMAASALVHPYYLDFYNAFAGGPAEVARHQQFMVGWWGEGVQAGCDWVGRVAPGGARIYLFTHARHVAHLPTGATEATSAAQADYVVAYRRFNPPFTSTSHVLVHTVQAGGAPIAWVYQRR